jgi:hypothetical protein
MTRRPFDCTCVVTSRKNVFSSRTVIIKYSKTTSNLQAPRVAADRTAEGPRDEPIDYSEKPELPE